MSYVIDANLDTVGIFPGSEQKTQSDDSSNTKTYEINLHNRVWHSGCGLLNGKRFLKTFPLNDSILIFFFRNYKRSAQFCEYMKRGFHLTKR